jgi:inositol phosphorylceramide mannosyltransferase catalytic subunit
MKHLSLNKILTSRFFLDHRLTNDFHIKWSGNKEKKFWHWIIQQYNFFLKHNSRKEIVPKKIHQIWLGSKMPKKYEKWIDNLKKYNPDYEYCLWDEEKILKLDLINRKQFIDAKNYGVKSDIARYEILYKFGGIYLDTDFEPLKKFNKKLLTFPFIAGQLFDNNPQIANGFIIASKGSVILRLIINNLCCFPKNNLNANQILNYSGPFYLTRIIKKNLKKFKDIVILPSQYFYPWPNFSISNKDSRYSYVTNKTIAIHHWHVSWIYLPLIKKIFLVIKKKIYEYSGKFA